MMNGSRPGRTRAITLCALLVLSGACAPAEQATRTLRVLASSELIDMQPLLNELRRDTGIELVLDYQGSVDATNAMVRGDSNHDLAWLSSDYYYRLKSQAAPTPELLPLSAEIMTSPVVVGMRPEIVARLRRNDPDLQPTWADIADEAAAGRIRFGMADPQRTNSGLAALVGVATAAAGTGSALRPQDIPCDRLQDFLAGHTLTAADSHALVDNYVAHQDDVDALIGYESVLLSLNASGSLHKPLQIIYPEDGTVLSHYPMLLLKPDRRADYDIVVNWLTSTSAQQRIMERTLRRPISPDVLRDPRLGDIGNALYFPNRIDVIDKLLSNYASMRQSPGQMIFLLDFSGSMRGDRISALRSVFIKLGGTGRSTIGRFARFYQGETIILTQFGGRVLSEKTFTVRGQDDIDAMNAFLASDRFDDHTAVWSALDHAYQRADSLIRQDPERPVTIVLMTDGMSNTGYSLDQFLQRYRTLTPPARAVRTYTIRLGKADPSPLAHAAEATGGRVIDADTTSLHTAFKEIRGCH